MDSNRRGQTIITSNDMTPTRPRFYTPEFRQQMVDLVKGSGRSPESLSAEFGPSAQAIRNWVAAAAPPAVEAAPAVAAPIRLTNAERDELIALRRAVEQLLEEREMLAKAAMWFAARGEVRIPKP